jgi:uncharacterized protein DUF6504
MTEIDEAIAVWTTDEGVPTRLVWRSTRYRVSDTPTVWAEVCAWWRPFGEHRYTIGSLPREIGGWRFQGTNDDGDAHVFDVRHDAVDRSWRLVRVFD